MGRRWFYLLIATVGQLAVALVRFGVPALLPLIRAEMVLTRTDVGLVSSVLNGGAAVAGLPAGRVVDRRGERLALALGVLSCGLSVFLLQLAHSFAPVLAVLALVGFLATLPVPAGGVLVNRWFQARERGTAMGIRMMAIPLGGALAAVILPPIALFGGWRLALEVAGAVAVVIGAATWLAIPAQPPLVKRAAASAESEREPGANRAIAALTTFSFLFGGAQWCLVTYVVLYLTETLRWPLLQAESLLAFTQLCGAASRVGWGVVTDRLMNGQRTPGLLAVGLLGLAATVGVAVSTPETPVWLVGLCVAALGAALLGWNALAHALGPDLSGPAAAGLALGLVNSGGFVGVMIFPPLFGLLVDTTHVYRVAWLGLLVLIGAGIALLPVVGRAERRHRAAEQRRRVAVL